LEHLAITAGASIRPEISFGEIMMTQSNVAKSYKNMTTSVSPTALAEIDLLVNQHWGLQSNSSRISCERDELFLISSEQGERFILRLSNPADDPAVIDLQVSALEWIDSHAPDLPLPGVVPLANGSLVVSVEAGENPPRTACLTRFLEGPALARTPTTTRQLHNVGVSLAKLGLALKNFHHPGAIRELAWNIQQAGSCRAMLPDASTMVDEPRWTLVRQGLDNFVENVLGKLENVRHQVIHADYNPHNILMNPNDTDLVSGILDFGDMVYTALVNDVAIAASYQTAGPNPLSKVAELVGAYHSVLPLEDEEISLLYDLIITRLCVAVAITEFRARRYPENREYILKNTEVAWEGLERLSAIRREDATSYLRNTCRQSESAI